MTKITALNAARVDYDLRLKMKILSADWAVIDDKIWVRRESIPVGADFTPILLVVLDGDAESDIKIPIPEHVLRTLDCRG